MSFIYLFGYMHHRATVNVHELLINSMHRLFVFFLKFFLFPLVVH